MNYERDIKHCQPSKYVKEVTVKDIKNAENSDNLDCVAFEESGWQSVVSRGSQQIGNKVFFIPPESVLPIELSEALGVTKYLSKGKVKVARLRGNRSEGLVVNREIAEPYIEQIMQWEDLIPPEMAGMILAKSDIPNEFEVFYKMPNLMNEPFTFTIGEEVFWSEKIHGSNLRFGNLKNPATEEYQLYVGTHNTVRKETDNDVYWKTVRKVLSDLGISGDDLPKDIVFYAELYGFKMSDLHYGLSDQTLKVFNSSKNGQYFLIPETVNMCNKIGLSCVNFHKTIFTSMEDMRQISDMPSEVCKDGLREGIVIVAADNGRRMAKVVSVKYLTRGGRKYEGH